MLHVNCLSLPPGICTVVVDVVDPEAGESAALGLALRPRDPLADPEALPMFTDRGDVLLLPSDPEDLLLDP